MQISTICLWLGICIASMTFFKSLWAYRISESVGNEYIEKHFKNDQ